MQDKQSRLLTVLCLLPQRMAACCMALTVAAVLMACTFSQPHSKRPGSEPLPSRRLQGHDEIVWAVEVSGDRLLSASADKTIRIWDIASRRCLVQPLRPQHTCACVSQLCTEVTECTCHRSRPCCHNCMQVMHLVSACAKGSCQPVPGIQIQVQALV